MTSMKRKKLINIVQIKGFDALRCKAQAYTVIFLY